MIGALLREGGLIRDFDLLSHAPAWMTQFFLMQSIEFIMCQAQDFSKPLKRNTPLFREQPHTQTWIKSESVNPFPFRLRPKLSGLTPTF